MKRVTRKCCKRHIGNNISGTKYTDAYRQENYNYRAVTRETINLESLCFAERSHRVNVSYNRSLF